MAKPTPGSSEEIALGCICPGMDNHNGKGFGGGYFWINQTCPIHGDRPAEYQIKKIGSKKMTKPIPGQSWRHNESGNCYQVIQKPDDYVFAGQLREEWSTSSDQPALRAEIESLGGMVFYGHEYRDFVRREADFLEKFTLVAEAE
jgi:hypothetical protein